MIRVKICGIRRVEDLIAAAEAGADAIGLVMGFPNSPRNLRLEEAVEIKRMVPPFLDTVLVLNFDDRESALEVCEKMEPDAVQAYGDVDPEEVKSMGVKWFIKPIRPESFDPSRIDGVDAILIDSSMGSGKRPDWGLCKRIREMAGVPVILSGGLTPENVRVAIEVVRPYAVDVSSGVESSPGVKDAKKIELFVRRAKGVAVER